MFMLVDAKNSWLAHKANGMVFVIALVELLCPFRYYLMPQEYEKLPHMGTISQSQNGIYAHFGRRNWHPTETESY
jgi:hypothetical protein